MYIFNNKFCVRTPRASKLQKLQTPTIKSSKQSHIYSPIDCLWHFNAKYLHEVQLIHEQYYTHKNLTSSRGHQCVKACGLTTTKDNPSSQKDSQSNLWIASTKYAKWACGLITIIPLLSKPGQKKSRSGMLKQTSAQRRLASSLVEKVQLQGRPSQVKFAVNNPNSGTFFFLQVLDLRTVQEFTLHLFPAVADTFNSLRRHGSKPNVHSKDNTTKISQ